jgi:hypothetical protein
VSGRVIVRTLMWSRFYPGSLGLCLERYSGGFHASCSNHGEGKLSRPYSVDFHCRGDSLLSRPKDREDDFHFFA